ncbi:MAG TPA: ribonuclease D, partial [Polyangiaceae bacterium]
MKLVTSPADLAQLASTLSGASVLFLDTEFESNRTGVTLCLLQVSRGDEAFLVDALALRDLSPLAAPFANATTWVLHAGQQDVSLIRERVGLEARPSVFDTQVAWALTSVEYSVSLAYAQFRALGLRGKKGHQADDWVRRPLPPSQLAYAAADVEHLPALHGWLRERAEKLGRAELVAAASAEVIWPAPSAPHALSLESFRNAWQLDQREQAALSYIIDWFNALPAAERSDAPENKTLLAIAARLPRSVDDLMRIKGVPRGWSGEFGAKFVRELVRAAEAANAGGFVPI